MFKTFLNQEIVLSKPLSRDVYGSHPILFFALVISGCLFRGSSSGKGLKIISRLGFIFFLILLANSKIVNSSGFPIFTENQHYYPLN